MKTWNIEDLITGTQGELKQKGSRPLVSVGTDTRGDLKNKIFFALKGENFDAHEFAGQAAENGSSALVVDQDIPSVNSEVTVVRVTNTLEALQKFARWHRDQWQGKVVSLTGSNGKTTTKEFSQILLSQKFPTLATKGNLNNHLGVPLTLLELRKTHKLAVVEMGMNHAGEITKLVEIARPDIVLVTNVGHAHVENLGSVENVARAKEEIYEGAPSGATRIYNLDDPRTAMMRARAPGKCPVLTYSSYARDVDVSFKEKLLTLDFLEVQGVIKGEPGQASIPSFGRQNLANAMAASCVALACGLDAPLIWKGLGLCKSTWGRGQLVNLENGARVLFDAYNANPESTLMAIDNFSRLASRGKKYIVFGDMLELGEFSAELHQKVGEQMAQSHAEAIFLIGDQATSVERGLRVKGFDKNVTVSANYEEKLARALAGMLAPGDMVLVKGSRGMKLERVVEALRPLHFDKKH